VSVDIKRKEKEKKNNIQKKRKEKEIMTLADLPSHDRHLGLPTAPSPGADRMTEHFGTCYKHHSCGSDHSNTTNHPTYD